MDAWKLATINALKRLLPAPIRHSLFHLSFHVAPEEFRRFAHEYSFAPAMDFGLQAMARRGFAPATVIDVGAYHGDWAKLARRIWPRCRLIMIEPNRDNQGRLQNVAAEVDGVLFTELLGAHEGWEVPFNIMGSGSGVLSERSPLPREVERRTLRRIDSLVDAVNSPGLLKIDAQGYELEILRGATGILPAIEAILLEIAVIEINEGAPLLHEVVGFMKREGFVVYDILEIHRRPLDKALNQVDLIFLREESALIADKRHFA